MKTHEAYPIPDQVWPSDNNFGIPTLDINMQASRLDMPFFQYDDIKKVSNTIGTLAFYTSDRNFIKLWTDPYKIITTGFINIVEPNFSTNEQMPLALVLSRIYMKRWVARYWQSHGIKILVDLNVGSNCHDYNLLGVPPKWKAYATRGYAARPEIIFEQYRIASKHAQSDNILFIVYGGGYSCQKIAQSIGAIWIIDKMHYLTYARRGKDMAQYADQHNYIKVPQL